MFSEPNTQQYFNRALSWLRSCRHCHSFWGEIDILCDRCWAVLLDQQQFTKEIQNGLWMTSLFLWHQEIDSWFRSLIYGLKGGGLPHAFQRLAAELSWRQPCTEQEIFIPVPSKTGEEDHAFALAASLAQLRGGILLNALKFNSAAADSQKQLPRLERLARTLQLNSSLPNRLSVRQKIILVDDVLVTGGTAQAAYKCLNRPPNFEIWVLARRPLLIQE